MRRATVFWIFLDLLFSCSTGPKKFKEDQCYQPIYWPHDCQRTRRH